MKVLNKTLLIIILGLSLCGLSKAQSFEWSPMNREIIITMEDSTLNAYVSIMPSTAGRIKNDLTYYWYDQDRIRTNVGGYSGTLLDGSYEVYDKEDNLITQGSFKKGLPNGQWKYWYENGNLRKTLTYKNGIFHGEYSYFDELGKLKESGRFRKGIKKIVSATKEE